MRHFSHCQKYTARSSRDSFAYSKSRHDSYPQFPRSSQGTRGLQTTSHRQKGETTAVLESRSAKASSTNYQLQGVPKVRSSNFMHHNFWSKLYVYLKFLEDVYFTVESMYSEFQLLAYPFCFFITFCSRCGMKWNTACRPTDDPYWAFFITWCAWASSAPKQYSFSLGSWKKYWALIQERWSSLPQ